ncbi:hypothetical protein KP005_18395 [Geomonas nitrogeniifigens]|uniref:Uncharacterized protein n=1 Tax=Geomonas diazotrophica TaxID=2843197 RepID=A0ABX8JPD4_9BACT|nr:hypothetical protein [Geomonas nitrogeniifigens]QWV97290.1 hypothetical protein KP005_18395 [Geomonas nitrogeniifigens]
MIRIMIENGIGGIWPAVPETLFLSIRVNPTSLLSVINRYKWMEAYPDGMKRWMVVNGTCLTMEQVYSCPADGDMFEWAALLLDEIAVATRKRRELARQRRVDLVSGINEPLTFGL